MCDVCTPYYNVNQIQNVCAHIFFGSLLYTLFMIYATLRSTILYTQLYCRKYNRKISMYGGSDNCTMVVIMAMTMIMAMIIKLLWQSVRPSIL